MHQTATRAKHRSSTIIVQETISSNANAKERVNSKESRGGTALCLLADQTAICGGSSTRRKVYDKNYVSNLGDSGTDTKNHSDHFLPIKIYII